MTSVGVSRVAVEGQLRTRAAYHEAAHAVTLVRFGFRLLETFLTRGTTLDGSLGGYTGWDNPLAPDQCPTAADFAAYAKKVVIVLYAGQCGERVLHEHDGSILVPDRDPNWGNDDAEAAKLLPQLPLSLNAEAELRAEALVQVRDSWHVIAVLAKRLIVEQPAACAVVAAGHAPASQILRDPDVRRYLGPIDAEVHTAFEADDAILRHEIGHLVTWFTSGGGVGPLQLDRQDDGRLQGAVTFGPRSHYEPQTPAFIDAVAERLLAGEVAARQYLRMCDWQISLGSQLAVLLNRGSPVRTARDRCHEDLVDAGRVLLLAEQYQSAAWWDWLEARVHNVRRRLRDSAYAIESLASRLAPLLPTTDRPEHVVPGTDLIRWAYDAGLRPIDASCSPVELVPRGEAGGPCIRARRWWRSWGEHATSHRGVEARRRKRA